jgi:hypothetical protein
MVLAGVYLTLVIFPMSIPSSDYGRLLLVKLAIVASPGAVHRP